MAGYRLPYSIEDDTKILRYLIDNAMMGRIGGNIVWQMMEKACILENRTFHSLRNRFQKTIVYQLHRYNLSEKDLEYVRDNVKKRYKGFKQQGDALELKTKKKRANQRKKEEEKVEENYYSADINSEPDTE